MYLDEMSRDGRPEPEPAVLASRRAVSLSKSDRRRTAKTLY
jgi:hypothetical protein